MDDPLPPIDPAVLRRRADALGDLADEVARACAKWGIAMTLRELLFCVRDVPYRRPSDPASPVAVVREWRGTCSGKHALVHDALEALGLRPRLFQRAYAIDDARGLPAAIVAPFRGRGVRDVHNFVRCDLGGRSIAIDVTWPAALQAAGFVVTTAWDGRRDFVIAAADGEDVEVPAGPEATRQKRALLARSNDAEAARAREAFIAALADHAERVAPPCSMRDGVERTIAECARAAAAS